jgi:hypothetical protein
MEDICTRTHTRTTNTLHAHTHTGLQARKRLIELWMYLVELIKDATHRQVHVTFAQRASNMVTHCASGLRHHSVQCVHLLSKSNLLLAKARVHLFISTVKLQVAENRRRTQERIEAGKQKLSDFASFVVTRGAGTSTSKSAQKTEISKHESALTSDAAVSLRKPSTNTAESIKHESVLSLSPSSLRKRRTKNGTESATNGRRSLSYRASYTVNKRTPTPRGACAAASNQWSNSTDFSAYLLTPTPEKPRWSDDKTTDVVQSSFTSAEIHGGSHDRSSLLSHGYTSSEKTEVTNGGARLEEGKRAFDERVTFDNARLKIETRLKETETEADGDTKPGVLKQKAAHVWEYLRSWDLLVV